MRAISRRLEKLEDTHIHRQTRYVWVWNEEEARAEAARLNAEGFNVVLISWDWDGQTDALDPSLLKPGQDGRSGLIGGPQRRMDGFQRRSRGE